MMIHDRRTTYRCKAVTAVFLFLIAWFSLAYAAGNSTALDEHAPDIARAEWKVIVALLGAVQALIAFIYISGIRSVKDNFRVLFGKIETLEKEKLAKADHKELCDAKGERGGC